MSGRGRRNELMKNWKKKMKRRRKKRREEKE